MRKSPSTSAFIGLSVLLAGCDADEVFVSPTDSGGSTALDGDTGADAAAADDGDPEAAEDDMTGPAGGPDGLADALPPATEKLPGNYDEPLPPGYEPPAITTRKAMTWAVLGQQGGHVHVGSDAATQAYAGDTTIDKFLPLLCVLVDGRAAPNGINFDFNNGWVKGAVQTTPALPGVVLTSQARGDEICADTFGAGWRLAEFHDAGGGWSYWASAGPQLNVAPGTRFWVAIADQPANPWNAAGKLPTSVSLPKFITSDAPVPNQYIAMFKEDSAPADVQAWTAALLKKYGGTVLDVFPGVAGFSFTGTDLQAQALSKDPLVESVEQDSYGQPAGETWSVDRVDQHALPLDGIYAPPNDGAGVNIYILDTGFRRTHKEFGGRARQDADFIRILGTKDDCHGHGTAVGSVAGGGTKGVARGANLVSIRIASCKGNAYNPLVSVTSSTIVAGLDWVARNHVKPAVASVSYGAPPGFWRRWFKTRTPMDRAVKRAVKAGVTVIAAAGNENRGADRSSPARAAEAISVSATDKGDKRASFANYGKVELFAPGTEIEVAALTSDTATAIGSGTSYSAPMVAGAAAIFLHDHPSASPAEVRGHLLSTATPDVVSDPRGSNNRLLFVAAAPGPGAMTWTVLEQRPGNVIHVGSDEQTDPYVGDMPATAVLPVLCARTPANMVAVPAGVTPDFHNGWLRGEVKATAAIQGEQLASLAVADAFCVTSFGAGWRMAEFHDGWYGNNLRGGWSFWAYGSIAAGTRFWTYINDQPANPWS